MFNINEYVHQSEEYANKLMSYTDELLKDIDIYENLILEISQKFLNISQDLFLQNNQRIIASKIFKSNQLIHRNIDDIKKEINYFSLNPSELFFDKDGDSKREGWNIFSKNLQKRYEDEILPTYESLITSPQFIEIKTPPKIIVIPAKYYRNIHLIAEELHLIGDELHLPGNPSIF